MKNNKLKLFIIVLMFFSCAFLIKSKNTYAIYSENLNTKVYLNVLDPTANYTVTLAMNDGSGDTTTVFKTYNETMGNDLYTPTRTNYNFMGWYDSNNNRIYDDTQITGNVTFHAVWAKIVCKKATVLNTETCSGSSGCRTDSIYGANATITYGSLFNQNSIFGTASPKAGDAYDCDVYYDPNDEVYDVTDSYGKHIQRFYFVREKENNGSENTAVLIYYTVFDGTGRVDTQHTSKDNIDSKYYNIASGWLPTSSNAIASATWNNPGLVDFDGNGKVSRFLSREDLETVCHEPLSSSGTGDKAYLTTCFGGSQDNNKNWFIFENSRFQSSSLARAGIWLETDGTKYYRIQTSSLAVASFADGVSSENTAKPVIEVPMSALEGFINEDRHTITFETHGGTSVAEMRVYDGNTIGTFPTTTRDHYTFDGWYASYEIDENTGNEVYSNQISASTPITDNMTLHAKWIAKPVCEVTLYLNGGTGVVASAIVDIGETYDPGTPTKADSVFLGWFTDQACTISYDSTVALSTSTLSLYADWTTANYVAVVEGVGSYESLADAIEHVPTGTSTKTKVTLLQDITLDTSVTIPSNKWVELDASSYTISNGNNTTDNLFINKGKLDIIGGSITFTSSTASNAYIISNTSGAILNISGGTLTYNSSASTEGKVLENTGGIVNISGGTLACNSRAATINNKSNGTLNVTGGTITASNTTKGQAIYLDSGTVNISGSSTYIESTSINSGNNARAAVDNYGGTLVITGGTIVSNQYDAVTTRASGATTRIGTDDSTIDITTPVLRGKRYGISRSNGTASVYDGIFESLDNSTAYNGTITIPTGTSWKTDGTVGVNGDTYHTAYLLKPTFTIVFYPENGENPITRTINNGSTIGANMPNNPTKANYLFAGWYDGDAEITSATQPIDDIDVYARWVKSISTATINSTLSIEKNSSETIVITGTDLENVTFSSSDTSVATVANDGTVTGVDEGTATITITGATSTDTRTVTVTVTPIMHTITFYMDDSKETTVGNSVMVADGDSIDDTQGANMPNNPTDTNYVFDGWTIEVNNNLTTFTSATEVYGDIDVIATWKEKVTYATLTTSPSPFTLIAGGSTGQIILTETVQNDTVETCTYVSDTPSVATVSASGVVTPLTVGTATITITGSQSGATRTIVVTVSDVPPVTHTITFYTDDTKVTTWGSPITVEDGDSIDDTQGASMPNNPTRAGYIFTGWAIEENNSLTTFTSATEVYGDIDVMATWKETITVATIPTSPLSIMLGSTNSFNVTATGGGVVEDYTLSTSDSNIVDINNKTIYGVAVGSVTLTITGVESNATRTITVNVINSYTVTFKDDNDDVLGTITVSNGSTIDDTTGATLPNDPTKSGYTFDDWYYFDGNDVTTTRLDTSATVTSNMVYKPRWAGSNDVAAIGTTYYETIALAINAAPDNTETEVRIIKDISNITCASGIASCSAANRTTIPSTKIIALNGGSHTVACGNSTANNVLYNNGGILKIKSGTFTCATKSGLATIENTSSGTVYIEGGTISNTKDRAAIYNKGTVYVSGGTLYTGPLVKIRAVIQNDASGASIIMSGGTVTQEATNTTDAKANGAIRVIAGSSATITGGTIISNSTNTAAVYNAGTLVIGHDDADNSYDTTSPIIQGEYYGIDSTANYSVYDGMIKGKENNQAVNNFSKITGVETGLTQVTGTEGNYYTLYYELQEQSSKYTISFDAINEDINPNSFQIDQGDPIETLPTNLTWGGKTFGGWYTDTTYATAVNNSTVPTGDATYYAKWTYTPLSQLVTFDSTNDAMSTYFSNISTWKNLSESDFATAMGSNFTTNNCSSCGAENNCNSPTSGTHCDVPKSYNTSANGAVSVYLYDNTNHVIGREVKYANGSSGTISNLIPGEIYYWEKDSDPTVNGLIQFTSPRRNLDVGNVRNVRDLGGLSATYTENNIQHTGTVKYGKLFRGAKLTASQDDVTNLTNLGITREIDLRANSEGSGQVRLPVLDNGSGGSDIVITNYLINPIAITYSYTHGGNSYTTVPEHSTDGNASAFKTALKATMQYIVNGDSIYFHCTIGTDRTGTLAYFLEGLLGVSEEDRVQDYELTYFYGLTNRTRYHDDLTSTSIYPRFKFMHTAYPSNQDIYNWYVNYNQESDDLSLLSAFRQAMIE